MTLFNVNVLQKLMNGLIPPLEVKSST